MFPIVPKIGVSDCFRLFSAEALLPIFGPYKHQLLQLNQAQYLDLVDQTGRALHPGKRGQIAAHAPPILQQLGLSETQWKRPVQATENGYYRAIGSQDSLIRLAESLGQKWIRGISLARAIARNG